LLSVTRNDTGWSAVVRVLAEALKLRKFPRKQPPRPAANGYPGDFTTAFRITYQPQADQVADPGEIVWTWVPYEEDYSQGKDRPVLIVGREDGWLLACPLTSKDHDRDASQEAQEGRYWVDIGSGGWDNSGRDSEVRVNRIIRVNPTSIRRISCRLDEQRFAAVATGIRRHHPAG
jgi:hypothetical protein